jgi:hypothetical protein
MKDAIAVAAAWASSSAISAYTSIVNATVECPSTSLMTFDGTLAASSIVAAPCRRSWNRIGGSAARSASTRNLSLTHPAEAPSHLPGEHAPAVRPLGTPAHPLGDRVFRHDFSTSAVSCSVTTMRYAAAVRIARASLTPDAGRARLAHMTMSPYAASLPEDQRPAYLAAVARAGALFADALGDPEGRAVAQRGEEEKASTASGTVRGPGTGAE